MTEYKIKMAVIAGASHALKYREKKPHASEQEILQHLTKTIDEIISGIEGE